MGLKYIKPAVRKQIKQKHGWPIIFSVFELSTIGTAVDKESKIVAIILSIFLKGYLLKTKIY